MSDKFVICGNGEEYWTPIKAKSLRGAKTIASRAYRDEVGGKIEVAIVVPDDHHDRPIRYRKVSTKLGFGRWENEV